MLGWLSGAGQRGIIQPKGADGSSPYMEEPPETPAPVFAVRAFKTALFGTPHPNQRDETLVEEKADPEKASKATHSPRAKATTPHIGQKAHLARIQKSTPLMSPGKSILLTPGTAAGRRKTVSFGNLKPSNETTLENPQQISQTGFFDLEKVSDAVPPAEANVVSTGQLTLTKELFEAQLDASKQRLNEQHKPRSSSYKIQQDPVIPAQSAPMDPTIDFTIDLTKPRSQSGRHWKAEYERYQKNSDRELKRIIQHGQNVKSYAEKKDVEATNLHENLKRELAKCAAMELKVSKLATKLASRQGHGPEESRDQEKLVNDLSRQTALAIRYKQKADRYRVAIQQQSLSVASLPFDENHNETEDLHADVLCVGEGVSSADHNGKISELDSLRAELHAMQSKLDIAEEKATKLEAVNSKLTKNFLRVKDEMQNYDARRVRKETRLKHREEKLIAEKKECEENYGRLMDQHNELLQSLKAGPMVRNAQQPLLPANLRRRSLDRNGVMPLVEHRIRYTQSHALDHLQGTKPSSLGTGAQLSHSRTQPVPKGPAIDIWTMENANDTADLTPPVAEPAINLSHVALSEATNNALREIDQNSVSDFPLDPSLPPDTPRPTLNHLAKMDSALQPDFPSSEACPSSAVKRMNDRRITIASPRPSMVTMASSAFSAVKEENTPRASGLQRHASLASTAEGRRSTLNGGRSRVLELPPDRAAAARSRIAQRKSMKENRRA
ncbi:MAG: hypothetical protein L6R35_002884 [Caloplaca aegaea]|nr:MAG: hypothetical protein L6R35_002884 [Caloplaca aegaea]